MNTSVFSLAYIHSVFQYCHPSGSSSHRTTVHLDRQACARDQWYAELLSRGGRVSHQAWFVEDQIWRGRKGQLCHETSHCHSIGLNKLNQSTSVDIHMYLTMHLPKGNFQSATTVQWAAVQCAAVKWVHENASCSHLINNKLRSIVCRVSVVY